MEGQVVESFMKSSSVRARLLGFCAAFSNLIITPKWEVQMTCRLLRWKEDLKPVPTMYIMPHVFSQDGTNIDVKLMLLQPS
ncbi:unnamed protein product, partial [Urochloa humidicola]